jgi:hypothetical protein
MLFLQFAFGLQPMRRPVAVRFAGFDPNLMGPPRDALMGDFHTTERTALTSFHNQRASG